MKHLKILFVALLISTATFAQIGNFAGLAKISLKDANTLANPYFAPAAKMFAKGLNSGWYTSAKPHKLLGFDITITGTYLPTPSSGKSFNIADYKLSDLKLVDPNNSVTSTMMHKMGNRPQLMLKNGMPGNGFSMPNGSNLKALAVPMITAGVGLPFGIEVKGRFSPKMGTNSYGKLSLWGLGIQKDLKNYIPIVKNLPFINVSLLAAYTSMDAYKRVDYSTTKTRGKLDINTSAFTTRLLVGANFPLVCFYTGLGYGRANSDFDLLGTFGSIKDPIKQNFKTNSFDANLGARIRLGILALHAEYVIGKYNAITAGVGVNFR